VKASLTSANCAAPLARTGSNAPALGIAAAVCDHDRVGSDIFRLSD
jgi:hypothetical protein